MKNVLVPTDFTTDSLQLITKAAAAFRGQRFNVVLFHALNLPDDIIDLLFIAKEKVYQGLLTDEFRNQCKKLKNLHFSEINSIQIKFMYGSTVRVFKNFAEANNISAIVLPEDLRLLSPHKYSYNPMDILRKSGIELIQSFETKPSTVWIPEQIDLRQSLVNQYTKV